jgi:putative PIN family toxin of toxin-antitoxin system
MGTKVTGARVVPDTNVLVSVMLFGGRLGLVRELWQRGKIVPLMSKDTFAEFRRVLSYPKFKLTHQEIGIILKDEILPYFVPVEISIPVNGVCRDPHDDMFLSVALNGTARYLVTGDQDLLVLKKSAGTHLITVAELLEKVS